jgi:hypothetical protein
LWIGACGRALKSAAASGSVSFSRGRGLRRCLFLCKCRAIKDVLIALSSPKNHTTHPLTTHPLTIHIHMCCNVNSFFVMPTYQCRCATTIAAHSYSIPVGTAFIVPAAPVRPARPPKARVYVPVHVPVVCIAAFFRVACAK